MLKPAVLRIRSVNALSHSDVRVLCLVDNMNDKKNSGGCGSCLITAILILLAIFAVVALVQKFSQKFSSTNESSAEAESKEETMDNNSVTPAVIIPTETPKPDPALVRTDRDWQSIMTFPTVSEITEYDRASRQRSPYICCWLDTSMCDRYVKYTVDFKADHLPEATYCCLANFFLDYSSLYEKYSEVIVGEEGATTGYQDMIGGYAGFQDSPRGRHAIMSMWDVYGIDAAGNKTLFRARTIYPEENGERQFDGEGTGAQYFPGYEWEAGRWYRMDLRCVDSPETGTTTIEQKVIDLETEDSKLLCIYDLKAANVSFFNNIAVFLECFDPSLSGEVRSLEIRNARITDKNGQEHLLTNGYISQQYDYSGSYRYGTDGDTFYMITTGVNGKAEPPQEGEWFSISGY